jgi:outer membrane protein TolC
VEGALAAFDTTFSTSMIWGRDERVQNNMFMGAPTSGDTLTAETGNFEASLRKDFAYGGQIRLNHTVNYLGTNGQNQLFPSNYSGLVQAIYRQPLWAGAGTEYTSIAGPVTQSFGGLSGVTQGVVIARINSDISIADFEANIRNLVKDVQDTYWDLYLGYRNFDAIVTARNASLGEWRRIYLDLEVGEGVAGSTQVNESQARDQYFRAEATVETARSTIYTTETRLRRLLGLPVNDGRVIRPADEPLMAEFVPDWQLSLTEALMNRVELRRQKWTIKSLDLQLVAARSLTRPRLDFVGGYQVNGFGDRLLGYDDDDGIVPPTQGLDNYYEALTQGNQTGWTLGFEFNMPIGFRAAHSQVRNIELQLAKAQQVLYAQELEIAQELAVAFQELARSYTSAQANYNRRLAAIDNVRQYTELEKVGSGLTDQILRAQERRAQAESDFYTNLIDYNKALTNFQFRKGTLLEDTNVTLLEDGWNPDAYVDAFRRAQARSAAIEAPFKYPAPEHFVSGTPVGEVYFAKPVSPTIPADVSDEPPAEDDVQPTESGEAPPADAGWQLAPPPPADDSTFDPQAFMNLHPLDFIDGSYTAETGDEERTEPKEDMEQSAAVEERNALADPDPPIGKWRSVN